MPDHLQAMTIPRMSILVTNLQVQRLGACCKFIWFTLTQPKRLPNSQHVQVAACHTMVVNIMQKIQWVKCVKPKCILCKHKFTKGTSSKPAFLPLHKQCLNVTSGLLFTALIHSTRQICTFRVHFTKVCHQHSKCQLS